MASLPETTSEEVSLNGNGNHTDDQDDASTAEPSSERQSVAGTIRTTQSEQNEISEFAEHDKDDARSSATTSATNVNDSQDLSGSQKDGQGDPLARTTTIPLIKKLERQDSLVSHAFTSHRLHRFALYETNARYFITGADITDKYYKVLKIDRTSSPGQLNLFEDDIVYSKVEINQLLTAIDDGNKATGGLRHKFVFWGLLGFIRFTESYYMVLVSKRQQVAMLGGHYIYQIEGTELVPLTTGPSSRFAQNRNPEEARFLGILNNLDLSKNFYFSYTYNVSRTLQDNIVRERIAAAEGKHKPIRDHNEMFVWNHHLLAPAIKSLSNMYDWCIPIIHGFIDQSSINVFGRSIYVTIIGRRSRYFAGARFLKRGTNDLGHVANDVETEQIVSEMLTTSFHAPGPRLFSNPTYTSYVHHRGSIPLYWTQDNSGVSPKPAIDLNLNDPFYQPAALHFDNLFHRYGSPIYVLNLIKARERTPRESKLLHELKNAIDYLNQFLPEEKKIIYKAFDMSRASKTRGGDVIGTLEKIAEEILNKTDFFHNGDAIDQKPHVQNGIARTNCIDCLDRTNAAQFVIGKHAFGLQLQALGVIPTPHMEYDSDAIDIFTHMFHDHGDTIAVQYGGSHLVNTMATYRKINHWQGHGRDMVESFKRYYHNSFLDSQRQEAYNLFLGNYIYTQGQPMLWELSSDYYLHHSDPKSHLDRSRSRKSYIDWFQPSYLEARYLPPPPPPSSLTTKKFGLTDYDDFWLEYYRPLILSSFLKVYSYRLTANNMRFLPDRPGRDSSTLSQAPSPFVPRLDPNRPSPDSPEKKSRKGVTIIDPASQDEGVAAPHSPQNTRRENGAAGILVHTNGHGGPGTPVPSSMLDSATTVGATTPGGGDAKEDKSLMNQWTLNRIYENSLNPSVSQGEAAEYERYVSHPSNIPLVVSGEVEESEIAGEYGEWVLSGEVRALGVEEESGGVSGLGIEGMGGRGGWDVVDEDVEEYRDFVDMAVREDPLTVFDEDRDKKRYKAYRQWLVKGKSLFKQSKVDPEYRT
ncbi:Polyphosphoinositide phosphatase [Elsinoe australis]|uniref:Polyphosphoinositide phosphatase n=1 Tax=Elsinoe australis TaxID=40998 RepID=A0A2P7ZY17_9PEZI|nr:Polyphosphoinositide phosphatase [Elsinoe australis]